MSHGAAPLVAALALCLAACFDDPASGNPGKPAAARSHLDSGPGYGDFSFPGDTVVLTGRFLCGTGCVLHFADSTLPLISQDSASLVFRVPPMSAPDSFWIELADTNLPGGLLVVRYWSQSSDGVDHALKVWPRGNENPSQCLAIGDTLFCLSCYSHRCSGVYAYSPGKSPGWELYPGTDVFLKWFPESTRLSIDSAGGALYVRTHEFWYRRADTGWEAMQTFAGGRGPASSDGTDIWHRDGKLKLVNNDPLAGHYLWDYDPAAKSWVLRDSIPYATAKRESGPTLFDCGAVPYLVSYWSDGDTVQEATGPVYRTRSWGREIYRMTKPKRLVGRMVSISTAAAPYDHSIFCFEGDLYASDGLRLFRAGEDALVEEIHYPDLMGPYSRDSLEGGIPITGMARHGKMIIGLGKWMFYRNPGEPWKSVSISNQKFPFYIRTIGLGYEPLLGDRDPLWIDGQGNLWSTSAQYMPLHRLGF